MFILVDCNNVDKNDIGFSGCFPYGVNEGPCVFDDQCKDDIFCGYKNCLASFDDDANCCSRNQFKSPNYPNNFFTNDVKTWLITAPFGSIINLQFHSFHVRNIVEFENITKQKKSNFPIPQTESDYDFVTINDGSNDQSTQIAKLSGNLESFSTSSTGNSLFVKFESDGFDDGSTGFLATIHYGDPYLNIK